MRIPKPIIFFANRKKTKSRPVRQIGKKFNSHEQAATMEHTDGNDKEIPVYERSHSFKRKRDSIRHIARGLKESNHFKTIAAAIISAIVIGTFLGFIMLNMFDGIGMETNGDSGGGGVTATDSDNSESADNQSTFSLEPLQAFVLQGGVFSDKENASEWVQNFQKADHPAMVWERDSQFILLAGIAANDDKAKELAKNFSDEDIYVKEWTTEEADITVTDAEAKWLKSFADVWNDSVKNLSKGSSLPTDGWKKLLNEFPEQSEQLTAFREQLQKSLDQTENKGDKSSNQLFLLKQWSQYETIGKDEK